MASIAVRKSRALGPSVKNLLSQYQLDLNQIVSTGPHQTLLKGDVLAYINQKNLRPTASTQIFSNPKAPTPTPNQISNYTMLRSSKYARKYPTQYEIDVINAGGIRAI